MCETSASVEYFLDGCLSSRLFVRSRRHGLSLPCPWGRNGSGSVTPTQRKTSRTRCVWGNTVVPELSSPPQRARPFHSQSIETPASRFSIAKGVQTQASPFHLSRSAPHPFGFLGGPSVPAFLHHRLDVYGLLVLPIPWSKTSRSVTGTGSPSHFTATGFLMHSSCPIAMDSWKFVLEIHWTWSELHLSDCSIPGVFSGRREGLGRFSWALQDPARNHPLGMEAHGMPCRAYLSFFYFCRYRFVLAELHVDDGSYWSTMVSDEG